jgi:hypothetical protein
VVLSPLSPWAGVILDPAFQLLDCWAEMLVWIRGTRSSLPWSCGTLTRVTRGHPISPLLVLDVPWLAIFLLQWEF